MWGHRQGRVGLCAYLHVAEQCASCTHMHTLGRSLTFLQILAYQASWNEADAPSLGPGSFEQLRKLSALGLGVRYGDMAAPPRQQDDAPS